MLKRLVPRTLVGQTVAILLVGVVLSNLIGLAVYGGWPPDLLTNARGRALAEQLADIAAMASDPPAVAGIPTPRPRRQPGFRMWASERPLVRDERPTWRTRLFRRVLLQALTDEADEPSAVRAEEADPLAGRLRLAQMPRREIIAVLAADGMAGGGWGARHGDNGRREGGGRGGPGLDPGNESVEIMAGALRLGDGGWLNFITPIAGIEPLWATPAFAFGLITTSLLAAVAAWATGRATRPLAELAVACERLGQDLAAPPVAERGPAEVRAAARAFNRMQHDLATFVRDRTRMLAAISHDLRTPLTRLRLRAELIEDEEVRQRSLDDLDEMQAMISSTLAFARDEAATEAMVWLDLTALLATVCDEAADVGGHVVFRAGDEGGREAADREDEGGGADGHGGARVSCFGRPLALKRAFANLIGNAVTHGGGAVVTLRTEADEIIVTVEDPGPGLPEAQLERVFEPFVRGDAARGRERGGVGLGLPIARTIIIAHGGLIELHNRPTGGLRATTRLPRLLPLRVGGGAAGDSPGAPHRTDINHKT